MQFSRKFALSVLFSVSLVACQSTPKQSPVQLESNTLDRSRTEARAASTHHIETVAILGTNDIHGTLAPVTLKTRETDGSTPVVYQAGGVATLASYVKILKAEFGDRFIWLDAGDEFQGALESNLQFGAPMVQFFNKNGLDAAAIGNHEFDFGLNILKKRTREANYPYLAANVREKETGALISLPNTNPHTVISAGKLKIGVIGLSTIQTPVTTRSENVKSLQFEDLKTTALKEAKILRKMGAHVVVLTAHSGLKCSPGRAPTIRTMRKFSDPQGECGSQDEMVHLLHSLPAGTIDAVVSGHTHQIIHHWVAGVPVVQAGAFGRYINVIYLKYDWDDKRLLTDETQIEGPIPVCSTVFQNQNDCNGERPAPKSGRGPLVAHKFHGEIIQPDSATEEYLKPALLKAEQEKNRILGTAVSELPHFKEKESPLGNLVADAMRAAVHTDFALINPGGVRDSISSGTIRYGDVFRAFPFDNEISVLKVTGKELAMILRVSQCGFRGFSSVSGLSLRLIDANHDAPFDDLNGDGKDSLWKLNRVLDVRLADGSSLDPARYYTLATSDFLVTGGDDLGWAMSKVSPDRVQLNSGHLIRDAIVQYIEKAGMVNTGLQPLSDSKNPRLKFENPPPSESKTSKTKRKHRSQSHKHKKSGRNGKRKS
jgi:5'-nucleotidase